MLLESERRSTGLHCVENSLWKRLWICHGTDCGMNGRILSIFRELCRLFIRDFLKQLEVLDCGPSLLKGLSSVPCFKRLSPYLRFYDVYRCRGKKNVLRRLYFYDFAGLNK